MQTTLAQNLQACPRSHGGLLLQWIDWLLHTSVPLPNQPAASPLAELFSALQQPSFHFKVGQSPGRPAQLVAIYSNHPTYGPRWETTPTVALRVPFDTPVDINFDTSHPTCHIPKAPSNVLNLHGPNFHVPVLVGLYCPAYVSIDLEGAPTAHKARFKWLQRRDFQTQNHLHLHLNPDSHTPFHFPSALVPHLSLSTTEKVHIPLSSSYERVQTAHELSPDHLSFFLKIPNTPAPIAIPPMELRTSFISHPPVRNALATSTTPCAPHSSLKVVLSTQPLSTTSAFTPPAFDKTYAYSCTETADVEQNIRHATLCFLLAYKQFALLSHSIRHTAVLEEDDHPLARRNTWNVRILQTDTLHRIRLHWDSNQFSYSSPLLDTPQEPHSTQVPFPENLSQDSTALLLSVQPLVLLIRQLVDESVRHSLTC